MSGQTRLLELFEHSRRNLETLFDAIHNDSYGVKVVLESVLASVLGVRHAVADVGDFWIFKTVWHETPSGAV